MRFRWKVLLCNIILVAIVYAVSGYLLMNHSFRISREQEVSQILEENQLIRATVEAEIVNMILQENFKGLDKLIEVGEKVAGSLEGSAVRFTLLGEDFQAYYAGKGMAAPQTDLLEGLEEGKKNYMIYSREDAWELAAGSVFKIDGKSVYVVNQRDITGVYKDRELQMQYFQALMAVSLLVCGLMMFAVSTWIMLPIEKLNRTTSRIAKGDYSGRVTVYSRDEVGELGQNFNQMAEAVESHINELIQENRRKEEFVANFTHEIKTPLTSVIGYADTIRSRKLSEETRILAADYIFNEGMRLETMSMKLFELFLTDQNTLKKSRIPVETWMQEIAASVQPMMFQARMELQVRSERLYIEGDPDLLKTVFINMIDNARKASQPGQSIEFAAYRQGTDAVIEVIDHGFGIPKEEIEKIKEAFYMVNKSRSRESGGAGLGLSLADRILKKHEAKWEILSQVGEGTTMRVSFPEAQSQKGGEESEV